MLNLLVMSKTQSLITQFFESLMPTIDNRATIYAITEKLILPNDPRIIRIDRTEFRPGKYFNIVLKHLEDDYMGIVNDDILFHASWLDDVLRLLQDNIGVSPGFIETKNHDYFLQRVEETKHLEGTEDGVFDAFYCFPVWLAKKLGGFDEDMIYPYDMDWFLTTTLAGYKWVTSKRVTIQHLFRGTLDPKILPTAEIQQDILKKWGRKNQLKWKQNSINIRGKFNV